MIVDQFGMPRAGRLDAIGLFTRPGRIGPPLTEVGKQRLERRPPIDWLHHTSQSQPG
jgi:hypothetical protein